MIEKRDLWAIGVLSAITLGLYNILLVWRWTVELNGVLGRPKYPPMLALGLGIVTLGLSGTVFESLYAIDVENEVKTRGLAVPEADTAKLVVGLNAVALLLVFTGVGALLTFPMGIAATVLFQRTMNSLADATAGQSTSASATAT
jgi:hypothetical protein